MLSKIPKLISRTDFELLVKQRNAAHAKAPNLDLLVMARNWLIAFYPSTTADGTLRLFNLLNSPP